MSAIPNARTSGFTCCNALLNENQQLRNQNWELQIENTRLKHKSTILTHLFEEHKGKYNKMQLHYNQNEETLKLQLQQQMQNIQKEIKWERTDFHTKHQEMNEQICEYSQCIREYNRTMKSLRTQIALQRTQIQHQQQDMYILTEQLKVINDVLQQKDETIDCLEQRLGIVTDQYITNCHKSRKLSYSTIKMMRNASDGSEYCSYFERHDINECYDAMSGKAQFELSPLWSADIYNVGSSIHKMKTSEHEDSVPVFKWTNVVPHLSLEPEITLNDCVCTCKTPHSV